MINRRHFILLVGASTLLPLSARAQTADKAASFVKSTGDRLVAVVNGAGSVSAKRAQMTQIINSDVDVDGIGRFCMGTYWRQATPEQRKQYLALFHEVLVTSITSKLGEYKGVTFSMGRSKSEDEEAVVSTTVVRPNNPPTAVDWIISNPSTTPKIIDVKAEGTSLRFTQREDYRSFLKRNHDDIDALITAMKNQVSQSATQNG